MTNYSDTANTTASQRLVDIVIHTFCRQSIHIKHNSQQIMTNYSDTANTTASHRLVDTVIYTFCQQSIHIEHACKWGLNLHYLAMIQT